MGPYLQTTKSVSHEQIHEENVYEFIPEYVTSRNGHLFPAVPNNTLLLNSRYEGNNLNSTNKPALPNTVPPQTTMVASDQEMASSNQETLTSNQVSDTNYITELLHAGMCPGD